MLQHRLFALGAGLGLLLAENLARLDGICLELGHAGERLDWRLAGSPVARPVDQVDNVDVLLAYSLLALSARLGQWFDANGTAERMPRRQIISGAVPHVQLAGQCGLVLSPGLSGSRAVGRPASVLLEAGKGLGRRVGGIVCKVLEREEELVQGSLRCQLQLRLVNGGGLEVLLESLVGLERPVARLAVKGCSMSGRVANVLLQSFIAVERPVALFAFVDRSMRRRIPEVLLQGLLADKEPIAQGTNGIHLDSMEGWGAVRRSRLEMLQDADEG